MGNAGKNKICSCLFCVLLISYTGCTITPERARELREQARDVEVLKQLDAAIEWELNQEGKRLQKDKVLVKTIFRTTNI